MQFSFQQKTLSWLIPLSITITGILLFLVLGLHSHDTSCWRYYLEPLPTPPSTCHKLRDDDWEILHSLILAQLNHSPPFPHINDQLLGSPDLIFFSLPVKSVANLFRPAQWGMFWGTHTGYAWYTFFSVCGLWCGTFFTFKIFSKNKLFHSAVVATLFTFSPYFIAWDYVYAVHTIAALGIIVSWHNLCTKLKWIRWSIALAALSAVMLFNIYPPQQLAMSFCAFVGCTSITAAFLKQHPVDKSQLLKKSAFTIVLVSLALFAFLEFAQEHHEVIEENSQTVYPGQRSEYKQPLSPIDLLSSSFLKETIDFSSYVAAGGSKYRNVNYCELSSFYFLTPIALVFVFLSKATYMRAGRTVEILIPISGLLLLLVYALFPDLSVHGLGLLTRFLPSHRVQASLGLLDLILFGLLARRITFSTTTFITTILIVSLVYSLLTIPLLTFFSTVSCVLLTASLTLLFRDTISVFIRSIFLVLIILIPLLRFGTFTISAPVRITDYPIAAKIASLSRQSTSPRWVFFNETLPSGIATALDIASVSGFVLRPLSKSIPTSPFIADHPEAFNRLATYFFEVCIGNSHIAVQAPHVVLVSIDPCGRDFASLAVSHIAVAEKQRQHIEACGYHILYEWHHIIIASRMSQSSLPQLPDSEDRAYSAISSN